MLSPCSPRCKKKVHMMGSLDVASIHNISCSERDEGLVYKDKSWPQLPRNEDDPQKTHTSGRPANLRWLSRPIVGDVMELKPEGDWVVSSLMEGGNVFGSLGSYRMSFEAPGLGVSGSGSISRSVRGAGLRFLTRPQKLNICFVSSQTRFQLMTDGV